MGLYCVVTRKLKTRKVEAVFYLSKGKWYCYSNKESIELFPITAPEADFGSILRHAEVNELTQFEIRINSSEYLTQWPMSDLEFINWLKAIEFLEEYMIDKDLSLGLLFTTLKEYYSFDFLTHFGGIPVAFDLNTTPIAPGIVYSSLPIDDGSASRQKNSKSSKSSRNNQLNNPVQSSLNDLYLDESFHEKLMKHINESNLTNADIYHSGGISKQVFSKIISTPELIPTKGTILCLAIGLKLNLDATIELLCSAGYALSKSIAFDTIVLRFISEGKYDLYLINEELNEYSCPLLGWHPRED